MTAFEDSEFMQGVRMGTMMMRMFADHERRRAIRAERKLEKLRRRQARRFGVRVLAKRRACSLQSAWDWFAYANNHKMWGRYMQARECLMHARRVTVSSVPGQGIPLPRDDIWAGQHYNRSGR